MGFLVGAISGFPLQSFPQFGTVQKDFHCNPG